MRIVNAMVRDRGMYICTAENAGGVAQASAIVEVERKHCMAKSDRLWSSIETVDLTCVDEWKITSVNLKRF